MIPLAGDQLGREAARRAAHHELQNPKYTDAKPPLVARLVGRAIREFLSLLDRAAHNAPGGRLGLLLLLGLAVLAAVVIFTKIGPPARREARAALFEPGRELTAVEHRRLAEEAAAAGRWADAVRERLRAVVRDLEQRGVLEPRPGRTAGEIAQDAGAAVPPLAADLHRATTVFDEIWYGGRTADAASYAVVVGVDDRLRAMRMAIA